MDQLVVDASVVLKWFFNFPEEDNRDKAIELRDLHVQGKVKLYIPQYAIYEIASVLITAQYRLPEKLVFQSLKLLNELKLEQINDSRLINKAVELAFKYEASLYDTLYLALAKKLKCKLVTADSRFVKKVSNFESCVYQL